LPSITLWAILIRPEFSNIWTSALILLFGHLGGATLNNLHAAPDARPLDDVHPSGVLVLDVADHAHALRSQRRVALDLDGALYLRALQDARGVLRHPTLSRVVAPIVPVRVRRGRDERGQPGDRQSDAQPGPDSHFASSFACMFEDTASPSAESECRLRVR
jgi:hypothetical protein